MGRVGSDEHRHGGRSGPRLLAQRPRCLLHPFKAGLSAVLTGRVISTILSVRTVKAGRTGPMGGDQ